MRLERRRWCGCCGFSCGCSCGLGYVTCSGFIGFIGSVCNAERNAIRTRRQRSSVTGNACPNDTSTGNTAEELISSFTLQTRQAPKGACLVYGAR